MVSEYRAVCKCLVCGPASCRAYFGEMPEQDPVESVRRLPPREKRKAEPEQPEAAAQEPAPATEAAKRPERPPPKRRARPAPRHQGGVAEVRDVNFPVAFRGYDR